MSGGVIVALRIMLFPLVPIEAHERSTADQDVFS
jgi:hypothetical protein